jgi:hypothetical protein
MDKQKLKEQLFSDPSLLNKTEKEIQESLRWSSEEKEFVLEVKKEYEEFKKSVDEIFFS